MSKFKKLVGCILLAINTLFPLVSCSKEEVLPEAKGYQWKVTKDNKTMYMIGTVHIVDTKHTYMTKNIYKILDESDKVAVELNLLDPDTVGKLVKPSKYTNGKTIESDLTKDEIIALKNLCDEVNLKYEEIKIYKPDEILSYFINLGFMEVGYSGDGVDMQILNYMNSKNKEIIELETEELQTEVVEEWRDVESLKEFLNEYEPGKFYEKAGKEKNLEIESYINGDSENSEKMLINIKKEDKKFYDTMLKFRNENMVKKIEELFNEEEICTIAVGADHFFGEDGIVELLKKKGYSVNRL